MLSLITARIASAAPVPPNTTVAAPLPLLQDDDQRRDELRAEAHEIERMIEELHERLGWIEREMEELDGHHDGHRGDHHGSEHAEHRVIILPDEGGAHQVVIDGEHSELIERLVEDLMEGEGRHEGDHDDHGDHHDHDGHHEDHDEGSVHHFEFPGGHGEIHVGVELHGDHGDDDHGHGSDLEEMLHELGIDLDGREMHIEMEVESEDEHGHHVEHRVIRIGGEHGHNDEECEDDDGHDLGGREIHMEVEIESEEDHGEEGERHVERRVIHVGGDDQRGERRRVRRLPFGGAVEIEAMDPDDLGRLIFEAGPTGIDVIEPQRRRARDRDMRRGQDEPRGVRGRQMGPRGGGQMLPEAMEAIRELREEVQAMRREMNEMRRRMDRR